MKTVHGLTYGTLPDIISFATAFANTTPYEFDLSLSDNDFRMFEACGLTYAARTHVSDGKVTYCCNADQLYGLLKALTALNTPVGITRHGVSKVEWAMDFASSILTTLGFEWI